MHGIEIEKSLYNSQDNRYNFFEINHLDPPFIKLLHQQAESVACLVMSHQLIEKNSRFQLARVEALHQRFHLSTHERFALEPSIGFGTAFLIDRKRVMTAAHCICDAHTDRLNQDRIGKIRLLFGLRINSDGSYKSSFEQNEIYTVSKVVKYCYDPNKGSDWAILKLNIPSNKTPLKIHLSPIGKEEKLYMLGYSSGLFLKYTENARVMRNEKRLDYFESDLDAFVGNSGSPIFKKETAEIVGFLCSGNKDYDWTANSTWIPHYVTSQDIQTRGYEKCQRMQTIDWLIQHLPKPVKWTSEEEEFDPLAAECTELSYEKEKPSEYTNGFVIVGWRDGLYHPGCFYIPPKRPIVSSTHSSSNNQNGFIFSRFDFATETLQTYTQPPYTYQAPQAPH